MAFYEPCTDCGKITGADMRDNEGACWTCQHRYADEIYARKINAAVDADVPTNQLVHSHMIEVMRLCYLEVDLEGQLAKIPYDPRRPNDVFKCPEPLKQSRVVKKKIQWHLDVWEALCQSWDESVITANESEGD